LHAFARDVHLSEDEWALAIDFPHEPDKTAATQGRSSFFFPIRLACRHWSHN
ncbi:MAG: hypothetical protein EBX66_02400, partial [Betaproteobacteria bacterium]|nr:hypothetical protein [Betaproteobacteria bacterium]